MKFTFIQRIILRLIYIAFGWLIKVENKSTLASLQGPLIFAFNHNSAFEALLVPSYLMAIRRQGKIHCVIDWMFQYMPLIGWIVNQNDPIYVYNKRSKLLFLNLFKKKDYKDVHERCAQLLKEGNAIGIFPEGTRNKNPNSLLKGRQGIGAIAIKSAAPVLPVGIDFPCRIKNNRIPRFGRIILRIGQKLNFDYEINAAHQINQNKDITTHHRKQWTSYLYSRITYTVMLELSHLSKKMYPFEPPKEPKHMQKLFFAFQKGG
jgi:1-acyl-sn-glycerol-3-phosphate acyltransferase